MHEHDDALIAALASDQLSHAEADAMRSGVLSCPRCRRELDAQLLVRRTLRAVEKPTLTEFESARLHHVIDSRITRPWYVRLAPALGAAAVLVLVAGIGVGLIGNGTVPADPGQSQDLEAAPAEATTSALGDSQQAAGDLAPTAAPEVVAAGPLSYGDLTREDLENVLEDLAQAAPTAFTEDQTRASVSICLGGPEETGAPVATYIGEGSVEGTPVEIYRFSDARAAAYEVASCEVFAEFP